MLPHEYIEWYNKREDTKWAYLQVDQTDKQLAEEVFNMAREAEQARRELTVAARSHARGMEELSQRMNNTAEDPAVNLYGEDQCADEINRLTVKFHCYTRAFRAFVKFTGAEAK